MATRVYDDNHQIIHFEGDDGYISDSMYDNHGNKIYFCNNKNLEWDATYDKYGNRTSIIYIDGRDGVHQDLTPWGPKSWSY